MSTEYDKLPRVFKGIALFTPGGDLVYCIDPEKRLQWHLNLCTALQDHLGLKSPPYFLLPCYTATVDRWLDPTTEQLHTVAEAYPRVMRFQALLNAVFGLGATTWQPNNTPVQQCSPMVIASYRREFPQLWENHDLILPVSATPTGQMGTPANSPETVPQEPLSYKFRLFVGSDDHIAAEKTLVSLRAALEQTLQVPYTLQLIDVTKHPDQAEQAQVTATPCLVRAWPQPIRRLAGDLSSPERLTQLLE